MNEKKGKCFSFINQGQRNESDFYQTPIPLLKLFLDVFKIKDNSVIWEPADGSGQISNYLYNNYKNNKIITSDLEDNFLYQPITKKVGYIITNPPFNLANKFILKSRAHCENSFAMLLPLSYLQGIERYNTIFNNPYDALDEKGKIFKLKYSFGLKYVYTFTRYPLLHELIRPDNKFATGMQAYSWFIFEKGFLGSFFGTWLNCHDYVVNQDDKQCKSCAYTKYIDKKLVKCILFQVNVPNWFLCSAWRQIKKIKK